MSASASNLTYGSTSASLLSDYPTWNQQLQSQLQHLAHHRDRTYNKHQLRTQHNQGFCLRCNGTTRGSQAFRNCIQWLRTHHHALGYSLLTYNLFTRFINNTIIFLERRTSTLGQIDTLRAGIDFLGAVSFNQIPEPFKALLAGQLINLCDQTNNFAQIPGSFPLPGPSDQTQNQEENTDAASETTETTVRESEEEIVRTLSQPIYPPLPSPTGNTAASKATPDISPLIIAEDTTRPIRTPSIRPRTLSLSPTVLGRRINPNVTVENILFPRTNLGRPITRAAGQNLFNPPVQPNQPEQPQGNPPDYEQLPNYEPKGELPGYGQHRQDTRVRVPTNNPAGESPSSDSSSNSSESEDNQEEPDEEEEIESEEEQQEDQDQNQGSPVRGIPISTDFDDLFQFGNQESEEELGSPVLHNRRDLETFLNDPNALNNPNLSQDEEGDQEINIRNILHEFDQLFVNPRDSEEENEPKERDLGTFFQNPDPLNIPLPESEDTAQESEDEDMAQNNRRNNNNNNNNGNNIFNDGQFQTWMQMITQAVNNVANP